MERIEGMKVFEDLFVPVYHSLLTIKDNSDIVHYDDETSAKASLYSNLSMILNLSSPW